MGADLLTLSAENAVSPAVTLLLKANKGKLSFLQHVYGVPWYGTLNDEN